MKKAVLSVIAALVLPMVVPAQSEARVVRLVVERTRKVLDGKSFGNVGPYDRLDGRAPRMPNRMVGFSAPFYILKPVAMARGNRKIFYGVNNRGNKIEYAWRTILPRGTNNNDPTAAADFGDALLMRLGYTYVDAGWQGNLAPGDNRLIPSLPVATAGALRDRKRLQFCCLSRLLCE